MRKQAKLEWEAYLAEYSMSKNDRRWCLLGSFPSQSYGGEQVVSLCLSHAEARLRYPTWQHSRIKLIVAVGILYLNVCGQLEPSYCNPIIPLH